MTQSRESLPLLRKTLKGPVRELFTLNRFFWKYKSKLMLGIAFVVLSNIFRALQPQVIRKALDEVLLYLNKVPGSGTPEALGQSLMKFGLILFAFAALMGLFMFMMRQTIVVMSRLIERDVREEVFAHYLRLDAAFYKRNKTGDLMSRIVEDVNKVRMYLGPAMLYGINLISLVIIVIFTMFQVNSKLAFYTLLPLPALSYIIYVVSNQINIKSEIIQRQLAALTTKSQESFSGIRIIKSYALENFWSNDFARASEDYKSHTLALARIDAFFFPSMLMLIGLSTLISIYMGGIHAMDGSVTPGNIAEFVIYVTMLTWPISAIGWVASIIQQAEASQKRVNDFLHTQASIVEAPECLPMPERPFFEFRAVTFRYPDSGILAAHDIHLSIAPGQKVGIVGRTASGKTTVADLLLRIYEPDSGTLLVNGVDIRQISLTQLRESVSYIPQDVFLFSDTISENIRFGNARLTQNEIVAAAKDACIHDEISGFAEAYEAVLGERGVNASGGQKQRISLARGLAKSSALLIMDDCLSAVDAQTELAFLDQLNSTLKGRSLLFITQRLRQTRYLDYLYVFEQGHIVQEGSFQELVSHPGLFKTLYDLENQNI